MDGALRHKLQALWEAMKKNACSLASARVPVSLLKVTAVALCMAKGQVAGAETLDLVSPITSYYNLVYAVSIDQSDAAIAQFTEDAIVMAGTRCTLRTPCVGKAAIKGRYLDDLIARSANAPFLDQRFDGARLTTHGEISFASTCGGKVMRLVGGHVFEFRDGLSASLTHVYDGTDAQTARFLACAVTR